MPIREIQVQEYIPPPPEVRPISRCEKAAIYAIPLLGALYCVEQVRRNIKAIQATDHPQTKLNLRRVNGEYHRCCAIHLVAWASIIVLIGFYEGGTVGPLFLGVALANIALSEYRLYQICSQ